MLSYLFRNVSHICDDKSVLRAVVRRTKNTLVVQPQVYNHFGVVLQEESGIIELHHTVYVVKSLSILFNAYCIKGT